MPVVYTFMNYEMVYGYCRLMPPSESYVIDNTSHR